MSALRVLAATVVLCGAFGSATAGASVISAGESSTCVSAPSGGPAACWGANTSGSLGDGGIVTHDSFDPVQPIGLAAGVTAVTLTGRGGGSGNHACAIVSGAAKCWGPNSNGELGDGTTTPRNVPTQVVGLESGVTQIDNNAVRTCAIQNGTAKCWGGISKEFSGAPTGADLLVPHDVGGGAGAIDVAPGWRHECIVIADASVRCYGDNTNDQLGNGNPTLPGPVKELVAGVDHNCALIGDGVRCWGFRFYLGSNATDDTPTPVTPVGMDSGVTAIDANWNHVCAIKGGKVYCWGDASNGRLGDGRQIVNSAGYQLTPVKVVSLTNVTAIAVGRSHSCAIVGTAERWCWGRNEHGQLGNEAAGSETSVPVPVIGASPKPPVAPLPKPAPVVPKPPVVVKPKPVAPQILVAGTTRTISRTRTAAIATLVCPAAGRRLVQGHGRQDGERPHRPQAVHGLGHRTEVRPRRSPCERHGQAQPQGRQAPAREDRDRADDDPARLHDQDGQPEDHGAQAQAGVEAGQAQAPLKYGWTLCRVGVEGDTVGPQG